MWSTPWEHTVYGFHLMASVFEQREFESGVPGVGWVEYKILYFECCYIVTVLKSMSQGSICGVLHGTTQSTASRPFHVHYDIDIT